MKGALKLYHLVKFWIYMMKILVNLSKFFPSRYVWNVQFLPSTVLRVTWTTFLPPFENDPYSCKWPKILP